MRLTYGRSFLLILLLVIAAAVVVVQVPTKLGLDLKGGVRVVLRAQTEKLPKGEQLDLDGVVRIIRDRVDIMHVSEPVVQPKLPDQVIVELPGVANKEEALAAIRETALLEFRYLKDVKSDRNNMARYNMIISEKDPKTGAESYTFTDEKGDDVPVEKVLGTSPVILSGRDLKPNTKATIYNNEIQVDLEFNAEGRKRFADFTRTHVKEHLAIVLDNKIKSAPRINEPILQGRAQISGGFQTVEEAQRLADFLNAGSLPVPLEIAQTTSVEATLGQDSIKASFQAGAVGLGVVLLFMILYYLLPGLLADIALVFYAVLTFAAYKLMGVTFTLAGICGFILSIGMAVDANILIFERLKEELRAGKTLRAAIDAGFKRAFTAIFDSNVSTAITCLVLYLFGSGSIKGFALTLAIGVAISMFTAITVTRTMLFLLVDMAWAQNARLFGLARSWVSREGGIYHDIIGKRNWYFALSLLVMIPGIFFLATGGLKPSIEFSGGSELQVQFAQPVQAQAIRNALNNAGYEENMVQMAESNTAIIRTTAKNAEEKNSIETALQPLGQFQEKGFDQVGAIVSKELTRNAFLSVIIASVGILLYLAFRFNQLKFGVCAVIALVHDVIVVTGIFAMMGTLAGWEVDSLFLTAMLTVIGFSVHDTIVIFDRIRENLRHRQKGEDFEGLVNRSILQSFARSINTSMTVAITLVALLFLGGPVIRLFVVALLTGVVTGTYSSIFNASPLLVVWEKMQEGSAKKAVRPATEFKPLVTATGPKGQARSAATPPAEDNGSASGGGGVPVAAESKASPREKIKPKKRKRRF
ncbi:MAG: protein translocase subunit SecD [Armatimonadetes bacterium]|nr:protein translocase subunit SecD [Armatimonadota bacterium]